METNSISTLQNQNLKLHQNSIEIISGLTDILSSNSSSITIEIENENGEIIKIDYPTIGALKSQLDRIESTVKTLSGLDGNSAIIQQAQNIYKKIIVSDINLEPTNINNVGKIDTFKTDNNWLFDSLLNPLLSIELNLTNKVQDSVRKILSRRFIIKFEKDVDGNLTTLGKQRLQEFNLNYKGKDDINIVSFVQWLSQGGIENSSSTTVDEQIFDLLPHKLQYNGYFSVLETENDLINKKLWYILDTLDYQDISNGNNIVTKTLKIGDIVALTQNDAITTSTTTYKVIEVSTITSKNRVRFERVQGNMAIPVRVSAMQIYSPVIFDKRVRVSIGFDEYNVIFIKAINTNNNIISKEWSKGIGMFTSDLRLDSTSGLFLKDYYFKYVYDYGAILQDLVTKKIPTSQGNIPNSPVLNAENFRVVQINKHLTDTVDAEKMRTLNNNKNTLKSELDQINEELSKQNKILLTKVFTNEEDRKKVQQTISNLTQSYKTKEISYTSAINEIIANKKNINNTKPEYCLRGFFPFPPAITSSFTQPQEVVQFEIYYRKSNISGSESTIETFDNVGKKGTNATFSQWLNYKTDLRQRYYDEVKKVWIWKIEDISDADTPNINQLNIPILPNERIEFKIRSISEVGYPEAPLVSEFSESLSVDFPTDLNNILKDDDFILKEATNDELLVKFQASLDAKGLVKHVETSFNEGNTYYSHHARDIASGFLGSSGANFNLFEKLSEMQLQINDLQNKLLRAKGELKVTLVKSNGSSIISETPILNGSINDIFINLESLVQTTQFGTTDAPIKTPNTRSYNNELTVLKDYKIRVQNNATDNILGLLSIRKYETGGGSINTPFAFSSAVQSTWVNNSDEILLNFSTDLRIVKTQQDYQWIWLKNVGQNGTSIYYSDYDPNSPSTGKNGDFSAIKYVHDGISYKSNSLVGNYGLRGDYDNNTLVTSQFKISDSKYWNIYSTSFSGAVGNFAVTVHPQINNFDTIVEKSTDKLKQIKPSTDGIIEIPLLAYYKFTTVDELFDTKTVSWFAGDRTNKETVIRSIINFLEVKSITKGATTTVYFEGNGAVYTNASNLSTVAITGSGSGALVNITTATITNGDASTQSAVMTTVIGSGNGGTGYAVGDVLSITQSGASGGLTVVSKVSSGVITECKVVSLFTLGEMGLNIGDYFMIDGVLGMTQINNKLLKINTNSIINTTVSLVVLVNSNSYTTYTSGGLISLLTDVTKTTNDEVWNSIGRDTNQNAPITKNMYVITTKNLTLSKNISRTLRFYLEPENASRPFEFDINFNFKQYKDITVANSTLDITNGGQTTR